MKKEMFDIDIDSMVDPGVQEDQVPTYALHYEPKVAVLRYFNTPTQYGVKPSVDVSTQWFTAFVTRHGQTMKMDSNFVRHESQIFGIETVLTGTFHTDAINIAKCVDIDSRPVEPIIFIGFGEEFNVNKVMLIGVRQFILPMDVIGRKDSEKACYILSDGIAWRPDPYNSRYEMRGYIRESTLECLRSFFAVEFSREALLLPPEVQSDQIGTQTGGTP